MKVEGKVAVITGAASGIGRALARRFKAEGAASIAVADMQEEALVAVADKIGALPIVTDVSREGDIQTLVERAENELGPIDIFCSNAGIAWLGGEDVPDADWQKNWDIHVMAHVYAARAVAPKMAAPTPRAGSVGPRSREAAKSCAVHNRLKTWPDETPANHRSISGARK